MWCGEGWEKGNGGGIGGAGGAGGLLQALMMNTHLSMMAAPPVTASRADSLYHLPSHPTQPSPS